MKRMSDTILLILFGILFLIVGFLLYRQYSGYKMFVNLVSGNEISSKMGLNFALKQLELGPVTILMNGEAAAHLPPAGLMMIFRRWEKFWKNYFFWSSYSPSCFFFKKLASYIQTDRRKIIFFHYLGNSKFPIS